jgi:hypothetical protein
MIRQVDKSHYNIPASGDPRLHRELTWYATDDDAVLGVVILDLVDKDYSWVVFNTKRSAPQATQRCARSTAPSPRRGSSPQTAPGRRADMDQSLPTEEDATALHDAMRSVHGR